MNRPIAGPAAPAAHSSKPVTSGRQPAGPARQPGDSSQRESASFAGNSRPRGATSEATIRNPAPLHQRPAVNRRNNDHSDSATEPTERQAPETLFQRFFKSVGPRTYVAQVKRAANGNHFLVLTEGKRDRKTNELRKNSLFVFSEDFDEFLRLVSSAAEWIRSNPVPSDVAERQRRYWKDRSSAPRPDAAWRNDPSANRSAVTGSRARS